VSPAVSFAHSYLQPVRSIAMTVLLDEECRQVLLEPGSRIAVLWDWPHEIRRQGTHPRRWRW
jgi:hypothetical protein